MCADLAGVSLFLDLGEDGAELGSSVLDRGDGHDGLGEVLSYGRWGEMGAGLGEPPRWILGGGLNEPRRGVVAWSNCTLCSWRGRR